MNVAEILTPTDFATMFIYSFAGQLVLVLLHKRVTIRQRTSFFYCPLMA